MKIWILGSKRRKTLVTESLKQIKDIEYELVENQDENHDLSNTILIHGFQPPAGHLGVCRCFEGHRQVLKKALNSSFDSKTIIVMEDDAQLLNPDKLIPSLMVAQEMITTLGYEIVCLHGRQTRLKDMQEGCYAGTEFFTTDNLLGLRLSLGCTLCYVISSEAAKTFLELPYIGIPVDILFPNFFSFALFKFSPILHDRSQGSLVENTKTISREKDGVEI